MEDVSVSGNVKHMRKKMLFYSTNVFRQYVLGTKIRKRHNLISLYRSSLRLITGVSKNPKPGCDQGHSLYLVYTFFSVVRI